MPSHLRAGHRRFRRRSSPQHLARAHLSRAQGPRFPCRNRTRRRLDREHQPARTRRWRERHLLARVEGHSLCSSTMILGAGLLLPRMRKRTVANLELAGSASSHWRRTITCRCALPVLAVVLLQSAGWPRPLSAVGLRSVVAMPWATQAALTLDSSHTGGSILLQPCCSDCKMFVLPVDQVMLRVQHSANSLCAAAPTGHECARVPAYNNFHAGRGSLYFCSS